PPLSPLPPRSPPPSPRFPYTTLFRSPEARRQLSRLVQPFLLRRLKRDVLNELPPKIEHTRRVPLSEEERKTYLAAAGAAKAAYLDRKSTRLNSSHVSISYAVFCLKKK